MAIRKEALASSAFAGLKAAYDDRKSVLKKWKAEGKKVLCVAGYDVPDELVLAAGMTPFRVTGYYGGERVSANKYLEFSFGPIWKGLWESIAEDYAGLMDYCIFSSSSDMFLKLYYYFRTLKGLEPERVLPEIEYLDYELVQKTFKSQQRNERELKKLVKILENWSGNTITEEAVKKSIKLCNEYRDALRAFAALRLKDNCRINGSEALVVIGGSMFFEKEEAIALIKKVTEDAAGWPVADGTRVYYAGSTQEITEVYEIAEAAGCNIVAEDHDMGDREFDMNVNEALEPISGIADRLLNRLPSSEKGTIKNRVLYLGQKLEETQPDVFLTYMNNNDEAFVWDYPAIRKNILEPKGMASYTIEKQVWPIADKDALKAQFEEIAKLGKGAN